MNILNLPEFEVIDTIQDEINGLFYIFDTNNIKINNLADALWINIDDVL
mgnify:CR=1 FL=1